MTVEDLAYSTIAEVAPRLRSRELSPVELTTACLERIEAFNSQVNAYITVLADAALAEAREAEHEIQAGRYRGPLHGIPICHKDLYYTQGIRTTAGSKILAGFIPTYDATVVRLLKEAGVVLLGKANMHEFALGGTNDNPHYGPTRNPWDLTRIPGGSSGGSAAALAAGLCLGATGSDTAGSIRIPSHSCGTTGIKPTYGRISRHGVVALSWSLDHCGPMARSVRDVALMLNAMAGYDPADPASVDRPVPDYTIALDAGVRDLRLGVPRNYFTDLVQPDVATAYRKALQVLEALGAILVEVDLPSLGSAHDVLFTIDRSEAASFHDTWLQEQPQDYGDSTRLSLEAGKVVTAVDYLKAQRYRAVIQADMLTALERADVLITPTLPITATLIGVREVNIASSPVLIGRQLVRFTLPFNLSGFPASSLPCGFDQLGLPIGLQIAGRPWDESMVLRVSHAYQQATAWHFGHPRSGLRNHAEMDVGQGPRWLSEQSAYAKSDSGAGEMRKG